MHVQRPDRDEERRDQRADDEAVHADERQPAHRRQQHEVIGQPGAFADQRRAQEIVDQADHQHAHQHQHHPAQHLARDQQVQRHRQPHEACPHRRHQRQHRHQYPPEQRRADAERGKGQPADRALDHRDDDVALHRGAHHRLEFLDQLAGVMVAERAGAADRDGQRGPVAEQEEQQIEHHAETDEKLCRPLGDGEGAGGDGLADVFEKAGDARLHVAEIAEVQRREHAPCPGGQCCAHLVEQRRGIEFAAADRGGERRGLARQRCEDQHPRDHHDADAGKHADEGGQRPAAAEAALEPDLQRPEQQRQDHRPEHRTIPGQHEPDEGDGDQHDHSEEAGVRRRGSEHRAELRKGHDGGRAPTAAAYRSAPAENTRIAATVSAGP
ncbi:hypothetical protein SDC9_13038 [bioreactor metagenome]|uniref:Uncharacterized protein n=1 Tax=bioreactor metagenome TaxID=1076179 RepID=A0A644TLT0_9ZZZZ